MKFRFWSVALVASGLHVLAGCTGPGGPYGPGTQFVPVLPGTYRSATGPPKVESDWQLTISTDRSSATETFTQNGVHFVLHYRVTAASPSYEE
jgi:hypothetical protein